MTKNVLDVKTYILLLWLKKCNDPSRDITFMEYSSKAVIGQSAQTFKSKAYLFSRNLRTYKTVKIQ